MNKSKIDYLNVGCGDKFHEDWTNVDMVSTSPHVQAHNLLQGFPYADNNFAVVYHSQVLEHFPVEEAPGFLKECLRVLRPGGTLRVVVPDLENIATEYLRLLRQNLENPTALSRANYEWIMLEMYDQTVRNRSGGEMARYLQQPELLNEQYVIDRIGHVGRSIIERSRQPLQQSRLTRVMSRVRGMTPGDLLRLALNQAKQLFMTRAARLGEFRLGGEIHMWMYDRFSLPELLDQAGFDDICVVDAHTSRIDKWQRWQLDVKDGEVCDPASLFVEASKPSIQDG